MENYSIVLFLLAMMIILSSIAHKSKLPYPILLVGAGIAIGFIPSVPKIELKVESSRLTVDGRATFRRLEIQLFTSRVVMKSNRCLPKLGTNCVCMCVFATE